MAEHTPNAAAAAAAAAAAPSTTPDAPSLPTEPAYYDVIIVGAGVAGLAAAAALHQLRLSVRVLERRADAQQALEGADLALWPGAISLLKMLRVRHSFFERDCFAVNTVHMCNLNFDGERQHAERVHVMNTIRMDEVTRHSGERFVLVSRHKLMQALTHSVPSHVVLYGVRDVSVTERDDNSQALVSYRVLHEDQVSTIASRVVIAADGANSKLRAHVAPHSAPSLRYCGEVCYRGVLPMKRMSQQHAQSVRKLMLDAASDHTMRICYGAGLRASFGYMSADESMAYWWVKVVCDEQSAREANMHEAQWPQLLKTLHDATAESDMYVHRIEDSGELSRWSTPRVVLVGDAAHVLSPNMGQGACLAIEDAVVVATLLRKYWAHDDGHLEAFYEYEFVRKPFVAMMSRETRKQLVIGQLRWRAAVALRNWALRMVPASVLQRTLKQSMFDVTHTMNEFTTLRNE